MNEPRAEKGRRALMLALAPLILATAAPLAVEAQAAPDSARIERLKAEALTKVQARAKLVQEIIDHQFSFSELGFQEFETQKYLTAILEKEGFTVERGFGGIPTMWVARWGSGKPVIALGSDVDCIPNASSTARPATVKATTRARPSTSSRRSPPSARWSARRFPARW